MSAPLYGNAAAYPSITVELGVFTTVSGVGAWDVALFDTGLFGDEPWEDITEYVRSITTTRGRSRELDRYQTGTMSVTLSNLDDRFNPANTDTGPYVIGGYSQIRVGVPIRVTATWASVDYPVFYGWVDDWGTTFTGHGMDCLSTIVAYDAIGLLAGYDAIDGVAQGEGELPGARIERIALAAGFTGTLTLDPGVNPLQATTLESNAMAEIGLAADSDGGLVFADAEGGLVFHDQTARTTKTRTITIQFTLGNGVGEVEYSDPRVTYDSTLIYNVVSMARVGGPVVTVSDPASVSLYGRPRPYRKLDLTCQADLDVLDLADAFLNTYHLADYRFASCVVTPVGNPSVIWPLVLDSQIRDLVAANLTTPGGMALQDGVLVDGISHQISVNPSTGWTMTFRFILDQHVTLA